MIWADYFILGVFAVSGVIGLLRGFIKEVMGIVVWVAAFVLAFRLSGVGAEILTPYVDVPSARVFIAFALVFLIALIVGGLLNYLLGKLVETTGLDGTDRMFGFFFGLARALILLVAVVFVSRMTPLPADPWWREALLIPPLERLADYSASFLPASIRDYIEPKDDAESHDEPAIEFPEIRAAFQPLR